MLPPGTHPDTWGYTYLVLFEMPLRIHQLPSKVSGRALSIVEKAASSFHSAETLRTTHLLQAGAIALMRWFNCTNIAAFLKPPS